MRLILMTGLWVACAAQSLSVSTALPFTHRHSPTSQRYLVETMGGGVALLDYNQDGLLDIFLVNGGRIGDPVKLPVDFGRELPAYWNRLYRQNADHSFTDVTAAAGLSGGPNSYGMGVAVGDFDNDGFPDLYVTGYGPNALYRNNGRGGFVDVTAAAGVAGGGWSASAGFFDYDRDGRLDLFVTRYLDWSIERNILCGTPFNAYCRPDKFAPVANVLYRNEGGGRFRDVSSLTGIAAVKGKALGVAFNDYDGDGFPDIFVANDGMEQYLFHNQRGLRFKEVAMEAGVAFSDDGRTYAGMGVVFADYDRDGRPDVLVTNLALEKYALYRNEGGGRFRYTSLTTGLAALTARSSGWGVALEDFDNDGWRDVLVAQSHVLDNVAKINSGLRYLEPPLLLRGGGGRFQPVPLTDQAMAGRGLAVGDLNNDGVLDAVITVLGGRPVVMTGAPLIPAGAPPNWLTVRLTGTASNRDGLGATVRVGDQVSYVTAAGSYLSASDRRVHFGFGRGLGSKGEQEVTVEINWPSGKKQILEHVAVNRLLDVKEPQ